MRKKITKTALLMVYASLLCLPSMACAQNDIKQLITTIKAEIDSIETYHAHLDARIFPSCISTRELNYRSDKDQNNYIHCDTDVTGKSGKKMKLTTVMQTNDNDIRLKYNLLYDGNWLWIDQDTEKIIKDSTNKHYLSAMKIRIAEVSPNPKSEPFNAFFLVKGNGLWPYRDLPGTLKEILNSYNFNKISRPKNNGEIIITGVRKENPVAKPDMDYKDDLERYCHLKVLEEKLLILSISYGNSEDSICMSTDIEYVAVNSKLPKGIFLYKEQEGVLVRDITSSIVEKKKKLIKEGATLQ